MIPIKLARGLVSATLIGLGAACYGILSAAHVADLLRGRIGPEELGRVLTARWQGEVPALA